MKFFEAESLEELIVFLCIHSAGSEKHFRDFAPQRKKGGEYADNHETVLPTWILIMSLQKLIRHIKDVCFFVVDKVIEILIDLAPDDNIKVIDLLRHEVTELLVHLASLEVVLFKGDRPIGALQQDHLNFRCLLGEEAALVFVRLADLDCLNNQFNLLALIAYLVFLLAPGQLSLAQLSLPRVEFSAVSVHLADHFGAYQPACFKG